MYDPEIPVDIVNLGLIYDVAVIELENGLHHVAVKMTLTAPGCGMGPHLVMEAKDRIEALEGVEAADVEMVWDPPWNQDMVSEEGRDVPYGENGSESDYCGNFPRKMRN